MLVEQNCTDVTFEERSIPVLWVSNIRQLKRPDLALELARALSDIHVHMIGGPIADYAALYESVRQQAAVTPNVTFHGQIPYHDVNEYFERARVFVNTSDIEGFPNSYLQAWARGTPVVAFFDPDGLIACEGLGRVVSNAEDLRAATRELATNADVWRATSARCKAFMSKEFGEPKILAPYLEVIGRLAGAEVGM
jgi:glycosyltransferase involved in cell wall biosynthesis